MEIVFSVEAVPIIDGNPEFKKLLLQETEIKEKIGHFYIFNSLEAAYMAKELLTIGDLFEEIHKMNFVASGNKGPAFYDFGLDSETGGVYLFTHSLSAFLISSGEVSAKQMAVLQMEEYIVFTADEDNQALLFIEKYNEELISNIARAYRIEVDFLVLDK